MEKHSEDQSSQCTGKPARKPHACRTIQHRIAFHVASGSGEEEERGKRKDDLPFCRPISSVWGGQLTGLTGPGAGRGVSPRGIPKYSCPFPPPPGVPRNSQPPDRDTDRVPRSSGTCGPLLRSPKPGGFSTPRPALGVTPGTHGAENNHPTVTCPTAPCPTLPRRAPPLVLQAPVPSLGPQGQLQALHF
ncbi:hypothetical protein ANANG_G00303560 [Anguilla anguilla]|uniref:Uncharacterized protein n=1 Tax=Anguilla anguilla TaxID=7936 RepID=A0A9D3LIG4_ANGAN|nr:hypothetical protein ANANG_G00303560 [Anguilla anguilla]